jgi:CRP-like cAMP-binding protein
MACADLGKTYVPEILNRVLRSFTLAQLDMLAPIEPVTFATGNVIYCQNEPITHLIFVDHGLVRAARRIEDGHRAVVIWVYGGPQYTIGTHSVLQRAESLFDYTALTDVRGWRINRRAMHATMSRDFPFTERIQEIARITQGAVADVAACRGVHTVQQRYCRQLVMLHRAWGSNYIPVSRPLLAEIVALSRGHSFRVAAGLKGIVTFHAESLVIDDLAALERRACHCFRGLAEWEDGINNC